MKLTNGIIYFLSGFIAITVVFMVVSALAELNRYVKPGIERLVCSQYGTCGRVK